MTTGNGRPSRAEVSEAVDQLGWRLILGALYAEVSVTSLTQASEVAALVVGAVGADGDGHLNVDVRSDRAVLRLQSAVDGGVTGVESRTGALGGDGAGRTRTAAGPGSGAGAGDRDRRARHTRRPPVLESDHRLCRRAATVRSQRGVDRSGGPGAGHLVPADGRPDGPNATESTSISTYPMTSPPVASTRHLPRAVGCSPTRGRRPSGSWPTRRATRPAFAPGRARLRTSTLRASAHR